VLLVALLGGAAAFLQTSAPALRTGRGPLLSSRAGHARGVRVGVTKRETTTRMAASASYQKPTVIDATEQATATVIWLHGLGDEGREWQRLAEKTGIPWAKFVFPTAPMQPCTLSQMATNSWYDIPGLSVQELREDSVGIQESTAYIQQLIEEEIANGTPSERIVLGGFSQGGCIALAAGLSCKHQLAGVMALSTWFPRGIADEPTQPNAKLPVMLCHGEVDPIAKVEWSRKSFDYLSNLGLPTQGNIYPGVGHEFAVMEVTDIREFIQKVVPPKYELKVSKPLGAVMEETDEGFVRVRDVKEGGNAAATNQIQVGDEIVRVNGKLVKSSGFDAVMAELIAAEGEVSLTMARPIPDRDIDFATLSEEEQAARYKTAGVIKVCSDGPCTRQGAKNVIRWLKDLTPAEFSVSKCGCTGNCGNGPNVVVAGKGKEEKVLYGRNTVGIVVKMLREEYDILTDPKMVQQIMNPAKDASFAVKDELVRQGILASITVKGSFETNRF
jgi:predicted esterase